MSKTPLSLQVSEGIVTQAAASIYSAYITRGQVPDGEEEVWIKRSLKEAILLARMADANIRSDREMD